MMFVAMTVFDNFVAMTIFDNFVAMEILLIMLLLPCHYLYLGFLPLFYSHMSRL